MRKGIGMLLVLMLAGCSTNTAFCHPNLKIDNTATGSLLGASVEETITGSMGWLGLISGAIGPNLWNALATSGCPTTIPVKIQEPNAKLEIVQ